MKIVFAGEEKGPEVNVREESAREAAPWGSDVIGNLPALNLIHFFLPFYHLLELRKTPYKVWVEGEIRYDRKCVGGNIFYCHDSKISPDVKGRKSLSVEIKEIRIYLFH